MITNFIFLGELETSNEKNKLKMFKKFGNFLQRVCWTWESSAGFLLMRWSFNQVSDGLENMIPTPRRHIETRTQTGSHFGLVLLPNQGIFEWSGSTISCASGCYSSSAQQKIPALDGKRNSITRESLRERATVSFSILARHFSTPPRTYSFMFSFAF